MKKILTLILLVLATPSYATNPEQDANFSLAIESYAYLSHMDYICKNNGNIWDYYLLQLLEYSNISQPHIDRLYNFFLDTEILAGKNYKVCDQKTKSAINHYKRQSFMAESALKKRYNINLQKN